MPPPYDPAGGGGTTFSASSCVAPAGATGSGVEVVHPATAAVTNTTPTVSSFKRVLIAFPIYNDGDANHPHSSSTNDNP